MVVRKITFSLTPSKKKHRSWPFLLAETAAPLIKLFQQLRATNGVKNCFFALSIATFTPLSYNRWNKAKKWVTELRYFIVTVSALGQFIRKRAEGARRENPPIWGWCLGPIKKINRVSIYFKMVQNSPTFIILLPKKVSLIVDLYFQELQIAIFCIRKVDLAISKNTLVNSTQWMPTIL